MPVKVLHCIHSLSGGGAERQLVTLANNTDGTELCCGIFCINPEDHGLDETASSNLFTITDKGNYPWKLIGEIRSVIKSFKPDIVHCWLPVTLIVPGLIAATLEKVPAVSSYRSAKKFSNVKDIIEFAGDLLFADGIASNNTPSQSNAFYRFIYDKKISDFIPNAVDVPREFFKIINHEPYDNAVFKILFVGRFVDDKNWQMLLKAMAALNAKRPWKLLMCGQGEDKKVSDLIHDLNLADNVDILGYRQDVYSIMSESDLMVLPSWKEGMPNVVLEAMSIGLPCFVSEIPAHTSLFRNKPVVKYFQPSDSSYLAALISNAIDDTEDLAVLARNAIAFSKEFTPKRLVDRYCSYYKIVIKSNN